jgi:hypothetical protein
MRFEEVADAEPTFGGAFVDRDGTQIIYVTDLNRGASVAARLATVVPMTRRSGLSRKAPSGPVFRLADFSFTELAETRRQLRRLFGDSAIRSLDVDETRNRVVIGVRPDAQASSILARAEAVGADRAQIIVEAEPEVRLAHTLRDDNPIKQGGLQIQHEDLDGKCTLGLIAIPYEETDEVVLTASHCSPTYGAVDDGFFGQATGTASDSMGVELVDPALTFVYASPPDTGYYYRYSDASLVSVNNTSAALGIIARTTGWAKWSAPVTISHDTLYMYVDGETDEAAYIGLDLEKMGKGTGWTRGLVVDACKDVKKADPGQVIVVYCSDFVEAGGTGGDSGGPVFYSTGSDSEVIVYGMVWGYEYPSEKKFVFSGWENIEFELDPLYVEY